MNNLSLLLVACSCIRVLLLCHPCTLIVFRKRNKVLKIFSVTHMRNFSCLEYGRNTTYHYIIKFLIKCYSNCITIILFHLYFDHTKKILNIHKSNPKLQSKNILFFIIPQVLCICSNLLEKNPCRILFVGIRRSINHICLSYIVWLENI